LISEKPYKYGNFQGTRIHYLLEKEGNIVTGIRIFLLVNSRMYTFYGLSNVPSSITEIKGFLNSFKLITEKNPTAKGDFSPEQ
jgi:hypothetical protein